MKFTSFLHKKLVDLLGDRRIVVWYDAEGDFKSLAAGFSAPNCKVLSAEASILKSRRRADEIACVATPGLLPSDVRFRLRMEDLLGFRRNPDTQTPTSYWPPASMAACILPSSFSVCSSMLSVTTYSEISALSRCSCAAP